MDFTPIITQVWTTLWYLIPAAVLVAIIKSPWFKGIAGEFIVNMSARFFLDKEKYHLIKNVTLPTEDGTTQIDHLIISIYGVFVVETKNMKGWIFGNPNQKTWTQKIYRHTHKFQNPLHQNYKHTQTLADLLELNDAQIFSVVVFVGDSTFKTEMPENVTYGRSYIRFIQSKTEPVLTPTQVGEIIQKIEAGRLTASFKTDRAHIKHVKEIVSEKSNDKSCPKCGGKMVLRTAQKGQNSGNQFWGCSNYPKCRAVLKAS